MSTDRFETDDSNPIVFLNGELVGYGVGPDFDVLNRAATSALPAPNGPIATDAAITTPERTRPHRDAP